MRHPMSSCHFGISPEIRSDIEYEIDFDGGIIIDAMVLKKKVDYNGKGEFAPHDEELRIEAHWFASSTIADLADEINDSFCRDDEDQRDSDVIYVTARAGGPMHYEGMPV